jgi:hypothetical protein
MFLNSDIPHFYAYLRKEYLYDLKAHRGEFIKVCVFGIASIPTRAIMFHVMTENGAQIARLPISAIVHKKSAPVIALDVLELWDSFSYDVSVKCFDYLHGLKCRTFLRDRKWYEAEYAFTVDWCMSQGSEQPGDGGHKNAHILKLDNGCFAAQPNNRIFWYEPAFIAKPFAEKKRPDYKTNTHIWKCEGKSKWVTEDTDLMFYDTVEIPKTRAKPTLKPAPKPAKKPMNGNGHPRDDRKIRDLLKSE